MTTSTAIQQPLSPPSAIKNGSKFRLIPKFEDDPRIVSFAQTALGKVLLLAIFALALSGLGGIDKFRLVTLFFLSAIAFLPKMRRLLVLTCTLVLTNFFWFENGILARIAAAEAIQPTRIKILIWVLIPFVVTCAALMWAAAKYRRGWIARRPLLTLVGLYGLFVGIACYAPLHGFTRFAVWSFLLVFCNYFWYLAYAVRDCATPAGDSLVTQFGTFHAFWGGTSAPIPKGASYWRRIEVKTPAELAITMIKGVKLIVWCYLLAIVSQFVTHVAYQRLQIPSVSTCIQAFSLGKPFHPLTSWASIVVEQIVHLLSFAIWGHQIIAICRMAGFRTLRNSYAPLSSRTIAEYFNRYSFYFKELLVDMFFYPAFIHCFTRFKKLRLFFATFAAVLLGSTLFHFIRDTHNLSITGFPYAVVHYQYAQYSFVLALAISISQIRKRPPQGTWFRGRLVAPACVFAFFCCTRVLEIAGPSLGVSFHYFAYLFFGR